LQGARPKTLPAAIAPVLVASAYAGRGFSPSKAFAALLVALCLQVAVNYANDYSDGIRGTDYERKGPTRLVGSGLASAASVKVAALIAFALAIVAGLYLAFTTSLWLILIGAIAIAAAWTYTGGSKPYGYLGLGEISVFIFFGLVATIGSFYVQVERADWQITLYAIAMGSLACCILLLNNIRDIETDRAAKKQTLSVRIGAKRSRALYSLLAISASVIFLSGPQLPYNFFLLLLAPLLIKIRVAIQSNQLIRALELTGKLQLGYALLLALALTLASM
jgi:1,4-dihydroxy-2-naphthoate octaprenyltransferase